MQLSRDDQSQNAYHCHTQYSFFWTLLGYGRRREAVFGSVTVTDPWAVGACELRTCEGEKSTLEPGV